MARTTPSPERARLAAALRELKRRTGLSLAALADRTPYSKSSWDRYLNGGTLPSRQAVQDLCALAGEPEGRCLALWEIAEAESSGRAAAVPPAAPKPADQPHSLARSDNTNPAPRSSEGSGQGSVAPRSGPGSPTARSGRRGAAAMLTAVAALVVGGGAAAALLLLPGHAGSAPPPLHAPSAADPVNGPRCRGTTCEGRNPLHMRCAASPGSLLTARTATGAWIELRHNERCGAVWARTWATGIGDRVEVTADGGPTRSAEVLDEIDVESYVYTSITAAPPGAAVRVCFRPAEDGAQECFTGRTR